MLPAESICAIVPGLNVSRGKSKTLNPDRAASCAREAAGGVGDEVVLFLSDEQPKIYNAKIETAKIPTRILGFSSMLSPQQVS